MRHMTRGPSKVFLANVNKPSLSSDIRTWDIGFNGVNVFFGSVTDRGRPVKPTDQTEKRHVIRDQPLRKTVNDRINRNLGVNVFRISRAKRKSPLYVRSRWCWRARAILRTAESALDACTKPLSRETTQKSRIWDESTPLTKSCDRCVDSRHLRLWHSTVLSYYTAFRVI